MRILFVMKKLILVVLMRILFVMKKLILVVLMRTLFVMKKLILVVLMRTLFVMEKLIPVVLLLILVMLVDLYFLILCLVFAEPHSCQFFVLSKYFVNYQTRVDAIENDNLVPVFGIRQVKMNNLDIYAVSSLPAHAYDKIGIVSCQHWKTIYYHALHDLDLMAAYHLFSP